ncbi:hypothetical protein [Nonomuraea soli]|uniref:Uncharacterized protein n=1 Tax=Nonomuraea soli TaxID=1032476 RepID=A0A7W0HNV9_9ACTN|nr:hypothetical protein [Nonomuraea soli]MBA2890137.1 hypothetical protein [Nonomuraea soli]
MTDEEIARATRDLLRVDQPDFGHLLDTMEVRDVGRPLVGGQEDQITQTALELADAR